MEKKWSGENKPEGKAIRKGFVFTGRDAIDCVIGFRIDSHTIMRGTSKFNRLYKCH